MPVVSVVVPCYNQGQFLQETLASLEAQTFRDFEIIVVDDGSTFPETIRTIDNLDSRRMLIVRTKNQGLAEARNAGIRQAKGRYILPLDADDKIAPTYLEKAVRILDENPRIGIVLLRSGILRGAARTVAASALQVSGYSHRQHIFASSFFRRSDWESAGGYSSEMMSAGRISIFGWD